MAAVSGLASGSFEDEGPTFSPITNYTLWRSSLAQPRQIAPPVGDPLWTPRAQLDYHSAFVTLQTPAMEQAVRQLRLLLVLNHRQEGTARRGLIVSGPPGAGKSTTLMELGRSFELTYRRQHGPTDTLPVAFAGIPPAYSPKALVRGLARFLCLPVHDRMTETTITDAVCAVLGERGTRIVFIDDVHLLNTRTRPGADTSDQLKALAERIPATFVLAGVDVERAPVLTGPRGAQLAARFKMLRTPPLLNGTAVQRAAWRKLLTDMEAALRLQHHRTGMLVRHADYIHLRTGGVMASLSQLVREAALAAVLDGSQTITKKLLSEIVLDVQATNASRPPHGPAKAS
ncbi:AAA family ATPase [Streptomyces sp. NBC_00859]|uniref:AAA family ATPase n=1 Tax=Streptomyces sp. NBC_00859 TaxID=2903682 RepID=UPI0038664235|nr:ATP-binding protein [Streptomyces sp. NBC_00859]WSZ86765.1 ATP-binding protein [Streptomyces sp. NBC_00859]